MGFRGNLWSDKSTQLLHKTGKEDSVKGVIRNFTWNQDLFLKRLGRLLDKKKGDKGINLLWPLFFSFINYLKEDI
jgi:hypothetical protein